MRLQMSLVAGAAASLAIIASSSAGTGSQDPPLPGLGRTVKLIITPSTMEAVPGQSVQFYISAMDTLSGSYIANAQFSLAQTNLFAASGAFAGESDMFRHSSTVRAILDGVANRDGNTSIDSRDVLRYTNAFFASLLTADISGNNTVDSADLALFRAAYDANPPASGAPTLPFAGSIDALQTVLWGDTALQSGTRLLGVVTVQIDPNAAVGSTARLDGQMLGASVYDDQNGQAARSAMVENGSGVIQIIPAPSAGGLLLIGGLAAFRRRRV